MENKQKREKISLRLIFDTIAKGCLKGDFEFENLSLNHKLFQDETLNKITSLTVRGYPDKVNPFNFSDLTIHVVFEFKINKDSKAYVNALQNIESSLPLPKNDFNVINEKHTKLVGDIVKYIGWRKGYYLQPGWSKNVNTFNIKWKWETDEVFSSLKHARTHIVSIHRDRSSDSDNIIHEDFNDFFDLQNTGYATPLYRELLTEVNVLINSNAERSAYLILYTTLEVATKILIKSKRPETDWLISTIQSPDLFKVYVEYINKEIAILINEEADSATLKAMSTIRNKIAHRGETVEMKTLWKHYKFVEKLIDKIDYELGYTWINKM